MTMNLRRFALLLGLAFPLALFACKSVEDTRPRAAVGPCVVPDGSGDYFLFEAGAALRCSADGDEPVGAVDATVGSPTAVGVDAAGGWAAVAYERGMVAVQLAEGRLIPVEGVTWNTPPVSLGVRGGYVGTVEDGVIGLYRVLNGKREWKAPGREHLEKLGLEELHYVLPLSRDELVVVGFKGMDLLSEQALSVVVLDRSGGTPVVAREQPVRDLEVLRASASDGKRLYLAGEHEEQKRSMTPGDFMLVQTLVVVSLDPAGDLASHAIVREERGEVTVRGMAVGYGLLALSLEGGEVVVYRIADDGPARRVWQNYYSTDVSVACLDGDHVVLWGPDRRWVQAVP